MKYIPYRLPRDLDILPFLLAQYLLDISRYGETQLLRGEYSFAEFYHDRDKYPIRNISFLDCLYFAHKTGLSIPSDPQWWYACNMGLLEYYNFTKAELLEMAWFKSSNEEIQVQQVGLLRPNALGLYDMLGNIYEWTSTKQFGNSILHDTNLLEDENVVVRGGSYHCRLDVLQYPMVCSIDCRSEDVGVRLCYNL